MYTRRLVSLGFALTVLTVAAAGQAETSYSLKELQAIARSANPTLESAVAALEVAAGGLRQAESYPNPELSVAFGRGRPRDGADSRSENALQLVQPIEMPGIRRWRSRVAELQLRGAEIERAVAEAVVDSTVSRLVYSALLEERRAEIARESVGVASRLLELLERRVELGESAPLEALKARSEWFARRLEVVQSENALAAARSALSLFCNDRLVEGFGIAERLEGTAAIALPDDLAQRLRTDNPVLLRTAIKLEQAQARTEVGRKEKFPRIDLIAAHENELDRTATSLGVGMTIPLWNRNRGQIDAAAAEQVRVTAETHTLTLELERSLEQASAAYRGARAATRLHLEGWTSAARQALDIATFSFENGEASLLDVLDAQRSYLAVRSAEVESWAALALARADIELLLAGPLESEKTHETR